MRKLLALLTALVVGPAWAETTFPVPPIQNAVTPFQYGATTSQCDGSTDISAAVQAAVSSGKPVVIPGGIGGICVFGDITIAGSQSISTDNASIKVKVGSDRLFRLTGYGPRLGGFRIQDQGGATRQGTLASSASGAATTISVSASADGALWKVGQRVAVRLDSGSWATSWITGVSGAGPYTLTLKDALPSAAASGARVWATFGLVNLMATQNADVRDLVVSNSWGTISLDDPTGASGGIVQANISNIRDGGGRIFSIIKGRNASVNTIKDVWSFGGWAGSLSATGDGSTTTYTLADPVYLKREMYITVGGVAKTVDTDYTIAANGLSITFLSAPANGAAIVGSWWTYGADGYVEDGRDTVAGAVTGGNFLQNANFLQYRRCANLVSAQLYTINGQFDTCSEVAVLANGTSQTGQISGFAGWAPKSLWLTGNALGVRLAGPSINPTPAGYQVSGTSGTSVTVDAGSVLIGSAFSNTGALQSFNGGATASVSTGSDGYVRFGNDTLRYNGTNTLSFTSNFAYFGGPSYMAIQVPTLDLGTGPVGFTKMASAPAVAPGAGVVRCFVLNGTTAGKAKLQCQAGTSTAVTTIADDIGGGGF